MENVKFFGLMARFLLAVIVDGDIRGARGPRNQTRVGKVVTLQLGPDLIF